MQCSGLTCSHWSQISVLPRGGTCVHEQPCFSVATWGICSPVILQLCSSAPQSVCIPSLPCDGLALPVCMPVVFHCYHAVAWANLSNACHDTVLPCGSPGVPAACLPRFSGARSQPGQPCSFAMPWGCQVTVANMPCPSTTTFLPAHACSYMCS